jgi:hypothetical protein
VIITDSKCHPPAQFAGSPERAEFFFFFDPLSLSRSKNKETVPSLTGISSADFS